MRPHHARSFPVGWPRKKRNTRTNERESSRALAIHHNPTASGSAKASIHSTNYSTHRFGMTRFNPDKKGQGRTLSNRLDPQKIGIKIMQHTHQPRSTPAPALYSTCHPRSSSRFLPPSPLSDSPPPTLLIFSQSRAVYFFSLLASLKVTILCRSARDDRRHVHSDQVISSGRVARKCSTLDESIPG